MSHSSRALVRVVLTLLFIASGLVIVMNQTSAQNPSATQQPATPGEPAVEQNHKNIQVLKGLP